MNWISFNGMLLNLDHTITIDLKGKSLEIYVEGSPALQYKSVTFNTEEDCKAAFDQIKAFVTGEGDGE